MTGTFWLVSAEVRWRPWQDSNLRTRSRAFRTEPGKPKTGARSAPIRIVLLAVFRNQRTNERSEVQRARRAMQRCIEERHTAEDD